VPAGPSLKKNKIFRYRFFTILQQLANLFAHKNKKKTHCFGLKLNFITLSGLRNLAIYQLA